MDTKQRLSPAYSQANLASENLYYRHTSGTSQNNRPLGLIPAFKDTATGSTYLSRFYDGRIAPMHLLDGLPEEVIIKRSSSGSIKEVKQSIVAGFVYEQRFYTRQQAADTVIEFSQIG